MKCWSTNSTKTDETLKSTICTAEVTEHLFSKKIGRVAGSYYTSSKALRSDFDYVRSTRGRTTDSTKVQVDLILPKNYVFSIAMFDYYINPNFHKTFSLSICFSSLEPWRLDHHFPTMPIANWPEANCQSSCKGANRRLWVKLLIMSSLSTHLNLEQSWRNVTIWLYWHKNHCKGNAKLLGDHD